MHAEIERKFLEQERKTNDRRYNMTTIIYWEHLVLK